MCQCWTAEGGGDPGEDSLHSRRGSSDHPGLEGDSPSFHPLGKHGTTLILQCLHLYERCILLDLIKIK